MKTRLLIVDDERDFLDRWVRYLADRYECYSATDRKTALELLETQGPDAVVMDVVLEGDRPTGFDLLAEMKEQDSKLPVIMISKRSDSDLVFQAGKLGGDGYLGKPFSVEELIDRIESALETRRTTDALNWQVGGAGIEPIVAVSPSMKKVMKAVSSYAPLDTTVLLTGETGTGKTTLAEEIKRRSKRSGRSFIPVHCPNLQRELVRSELFGHEKGAFTGAHQRKRGLCEIADGGTLFLDEVGDLEAGVQGSLLRLLDEGTFERVGGARTFKVDIRIIAATKFDLSEEVKKGRFRDDLFFRLNVCPIKLDPLRERTEDILPLAEQILTSLCRKHSVTLQEFSPRAREMLVKYSWPGNVREFRNVLERVIIRRLTSNTTHPIGADELDIDCPQVAENEESLDYHDQKQRYLRRFQQDYLSKLLEQTGRDVAAAADLAGLPRASIYRMMKQVGVSFEK